MFDLFGIWTTSVIFLHEVPCKDIEGSGMSLAFPVLCESVCCWDQSFMNGDFLNGTVDGFDHEIEFLF